MAANIEQIFQDFILNKIREVEDQHEDKAAAGGSDACREKAGTEDAVSDRDKHKDRSSTSPKKHKKHKKHKSKKKKRNRLKEDRESSSESGVETEGGSKRQLRRGTPTEAKTGHDEGEARCHRRCSSGKKKKKKKKKRKSESSSDSDSEAKQRSSRRGRSVSPRRREELPDIIPKDETSNKDRGDEERHSTRSCRHCSHSHSHSHSCSQKTDSRNHQQHQRSRSRSGSSSPRKRAEVEPAAQPTQGPLPLPLPLPPPPLQVSSTQGGARVEEQLMENSAGLMSSEKTTEKGEEVVKETEPGSAASLAISPVPNPAAEPGLPQPASACSTSVKSPAKKRRKSSKCPERKKESKSSKRRKRSKSPSRSHRKRSRTRSRSKTTRSRSRSRSPSKKRRSRSRSGGRRPRRSRTRSRSRSRSRSASRSRRRANYSQRDRWKREPSHSPVLILRKNRSPSRKHCSAAGHSPQRISELDKEQLLEIAKANAAAMCAKAGMPIPASLRTSVLPMALPSMAMNAAMASMTAATMTAALSNMGALSSLLPLSSISNKPPAAAAAAPVASALDEVKRKVAKQANSISIKEFTDKCKMIVDSKGELPVAMPHVSDEEDDSKPFGGAALREQKAISFNISNATIRPTVRSDAGMAKEFPVSSGSQHRKKEGEALGAYGEWVPVDKMADKSAAGCRKAMAVVPTATAAAASSSGEALAAAGLAEAGEQPPFVPDNNSVFPDPVMQPVDISQAVTERIKAQRRLAENPYDVNAICMLSRAQEQVDAWAQSNTVPGLFTGSTGAQVLSSEELSNSGPQAWLKKDQFLRAAPVSGGVGEFLMRKMGWRTGEGLGRNREGTVEPIIIDFKVDRKGLVAEGEKPQKQTGGLVVTKDLMGKHPVSALIELCNKRRIMQPDFVMVHHSGPDHRKNFLFKVTVNGVDYQPQQASPNKKHAKAMAATVALQALGEVPVDGPGLYTGPVFTAASTGPLFST